MFAATGGEEFAVILPETDIRGAVVTGNRIRERIQARPFPVCDDRSVPVTVSLGAASLPGDASNADGLMERADTALYQAKNQGRSRLVTAASWLNTTATADPAERNDKPYSCR